jgi:hypothetical protein
MKNEAEENPDKNRLEEDINNENFQFVLKELLKAYKPVMEEDLHRVEDIELLKRELEKNPPSCEDEIRLADRLFQPFTREEIALRLIDPAVREQLGSIDKWRWCLSHLVCCLKFGWLLRRGRTFRSAVYYLYLYWRCARRAVGFDPTGRPLTKEERSDFRTLVKSLSEVYKPFLAAEMGVVDSSENAALDVVEGKVDCEEGMAEAGEIFEKFLTPAIAPALFGKEAFYSLSQNNSFWFCRCWCLCAIKFGWCLAGARNLLYVVLCLLAYMRCLRNCFQPLTCNLNAPKNCVEESLISSKAIIGVEIGGTAGGAFCSHYTLEWRKAGSAAWRSDGIRYLGAPEPSQGICGVISGTLGYLQTLPLVEPGPIEIRLCVFSSLTGVAAKCCTIAFTLQRSLACISGIEGFTAATPPGVFDPTAQIVNGDGDVLSFGTELKIFGSAWIGGCHLRDIKSYTLSYHSGFVTDPLLPGFVQFWQVDYIVPLQKDANMNKVFERELTNRWRELKICLPPPIGCIVLSNYLEGIRWSTEVPRSYPIVPSGLPYWQSTPLPQTNCQSGKYTLRLKVEDESGNVVYRLRPVWFDNKRIYGDISQIAGVPVCEAIRLSKFAGLDCKTEWPVQLMGIAYDQYIEEGNSSVPSDNFGGYTLRIKKEGGPWFQIPIPGASIPADYVGSSRVGDPGERCANAVPTGPSPLTEVDGILTVLDMRRLDAVCNPSEPALTLKRGECCTYIFELYVWDKSICPGIAGGCHYVYDHFSIYICNDLGKVD